MPIYGRNGGFEIMPNFRLREFFLTGNEKQYLTNLLEQQTDEQAKTINLKIKALATL